MNQPQLSAIHGNEVDPDVEKLWAEVFKASAIVIVHSKKFGFTGMSKADPSIDDLLLYMKLIEGAIDALIENPDAVTLEEMRKLLNAQKQFANLKWVAKTLQQGDRTAFNEAMRNLEGQAPF